MDRFDRIYALHKILANSRYPVSRKTIQEELECSRATFTRIIEDLRDYLGAPIVYNRKYNGYHYDNNGERPYELPGLWFNSNEIHALLACQELLKGVQPGLLDEHIKPLTERIGKILAAEKTVSGELARRIRVLRIGSRAPGEAVFQTVAEAVGQRRRVLMNYHSRASGDRTEREVSPQRIVYYRDNWYLDGWCHMRNGLRSFSIDRIERVERLKKKARNVKEKELDEYYAASYGIFGGKPGKTAVLRFSEPASPWIAAEKWHPQQVEKKVDGRLELAIPYSDPRELLMDILRHGEDVEIIAPEELRDQVKERLKRTLAHYE